MLCGASRAFVGLALVPMTQPNLSPAVNMRVQFLAAVTSGEGNDPGISLDIIS